MGILSYRNIVKNGIVENNGARGRPMRHKHKKNQKTSRCALLDALAIFSKVAAIIGTIVAIVDTLHRW